MMITTSLRKGKGKWSRQGYRYISLDRFWKVVKSNALDHLKTWHL